MRIHPTTRKPQCQRPFGGAADSVSEVEARGRSRSWEGGGGRTTREASNRHTEESQCHEKPRTAHGPFVFAPDIVTGTDTSVGDLFQRAKRFRAVHTIRTIDSSPSRPRHSLKPTPQRPLVGATDWAKAADALERLVPAACGEGRALAERPPPRSHNRHEQNNTVE